MTAPPQKDAVKMRVLDAAAKQLTSTEAATTSVNSSNTSKTAAKKTTVSAVVHARKRKLVTGALQGARSMTSAHSVVTGSKSAAAHDTKTSKHGLQGKARAADSSAALRKKAKQLKQDVYQFDSDTSAQMLPNPKAVPLEGKPKPRGRPKGSKNKKTLLIELAKARAKHATGAVKADEESGSVTAEYETEDETEVIGGDVTMSENEDVDASQFIQDGVHKLEDADESSAVAVNEAATQVKASPSEHVTLGPTAANGTSGAAIKHRPKRQKRVVRKKNEPTRIVVSGNIVKSKYKYSHPAVVSQKVATQVRADLEKPSPDSEEDDATQRATHQFTMSVESNVKAVRMSDALAVAAETQKKTDKVKSKHQDGGKTAVKAPAKKVFTSRTGRRLKLKSNVVSLAKRDQSEEALPDDDSSEQPAWLSDVTASILDSAASAVPMDESLVSHELAENSLAMLKMPPGNATAQDSRSKTAADDNTDVTAADGDSSKRRGRGGKRRQLRAVNTQPVTPKTPAASDAAVSSFVMRRHS